MDYEILDDNREVIGPWEMDVNEAVDTVLDGYEDSEIKDQNWVLSILMGDNPFSRSLLKRTTNRAEMKVVKSSYKDPESGRIPSENVYNLHTDLGVIHYQSSRKEIRLDKPDLDYWL